MSYEKLRNEKDGAIPEVGEGEICETRKRHTKDFLKEEYDPQKKEHQQYASKEEYAEVKHQEYLQAEIKNKFEEDDIEIKNAREGIKVLTEKLSEANIDRVTGLMLGKNLFKQMRSKVNEIFEIDKGASKEAIFETIVKGNLEDLRAENFSIMIADVSFLALVNQGGHQDGDKFLKDICQEVQKRNVDSFRHGGDEISALFEISEEELKVLVKEMQVSINNLYVKKLKEHDLQPHLDVGTAHISEAVQVFQEMAKNKECQKILKDKPSKELEQIMEAIADKRSFINKGKVRTDLLARRLMHNKKAYHEVIGSLSKGAYDITGSELRKIINVAKGGLSARLGAFLKQLTGGEKDEQVSAKDNREIRKRLDVAVIDFVENRERNALEKKFKSPDKYEYIKAKAIYDLVENKK